MRNKAVFPPEHLILEDFSDKFVIDSYAELPDTHENQLTIMSFFQRADELGYNIDVLEHEFNIAKQAAIAFEGSMIMSGLPDFVKLSDNWDFVPERPEPLIDGVLRRGHKMLISGASKAGKSFLLMELAIALAEGTKWLGFPCKKSRVLYINLEIDSASCINRFVDIYHALGYEHKPPHIDDIEIWNLRGKAVELKELTDPLIERVKNKDLDAIIFDPIYKIMMGDENSASDMGKFCNEFDKVANETGCSVIYAHHHAKGAMGGRKAQDRASGSGVFARDPDAILDIIELNIPDEFAQDFVPPSGRNINASPWRLEGSLREFANFKPINFWYDCPLHVLDLDGSLEKLYASGDPKSNLESSPNRRKSDNALEKVKDAFNELKGTGYFVNLAIMADKIGITDKTLRRWITEKCDGFYYFDNGRVYRK